MSEVSGGASSIGRSRSQPLVSVSFAQPTTRLSHTCYLYDQQQQQHSDAATDRGEAVTLDLGVLAATLTSQLYCLTLTALDAQQPLSLRLSSTLGEIAAFQLSNENVRDGSMVEVSSVYQLLNEVDYVDHVLLQPSQPTQLILVFHPHIALQQQQQSEAATVVQIKGQLLFHLSQWPGNTQDCDKSTGEDVERAPCLAIPLQCVVGRSVLNVAGVERELLFDHCVPHTIYHRAVTVRNEAPIATSLYLHMHHVALDGGRHSTHSHSHHYGKQQQQHHSAQHKHDQLSLHPHVSPYHSPVFEVTESDTGKRLMLHSDPSPPAAVLDEPPAAAARELPCFHLQAGAAVRLRISFRPPPLSVDVHRIYIGEKTHQLHLHNRLDSAGNNITVTMHTSVSADKRAAGFLMLPPSQHVQAERKAIVRALATMLGIDKGSSEASIKLAAVNNVHTHHVGVESTEYQVAREQRHRHLQQQQQQQEEAELSELDFGDCYSGSQAVRIFSVSNTTSDTLEVTLGSAHAKGEVTFHLISDSFDGSIGGSRKSSTITTQHAGGGRDDNSRQQRVTAATREKAKEAAEKLALLADEELLSTTSLNSLLAHTAQQADDTVQQPARQFTPSLARIDSESNLLAVDAPQSPHSQSDTRAASAHQQPHAEHNGVPSALTAAPPVLPSPHSIPNRRSPSPLAGSFSLMSPLSAGSPISLLTAGRVTSELVIDMQQQGVVSPAAAAGTASPPSTSRGVSAILASRQSSSTSPSSSISSRLSSSFGAADGRSSRVGVIYLRPDTRRDLVVSYKPAEDADGLLRSEAAETTDDDAAAAAAGVDSMSPLYSLHQRRFRLTFNVVVCDAASVHMHPMPVSAPSTPLNSFTKRLRATARVCTSFVSLEQSTLHFGDVNLGTKRTESARLYNHSELPALMEVSIVSQSIKVRQVQLIIPPRSPYSLKMDMVPRKINAQYHKHLSLSNRNNPDNHLTLRVTAHVIDEHNVLFHDSLYSLTSPTFLELLQPQTVSKGTHQPRDSGMEMPQVRRSQSFSVNNTKPALHPAAASSSFSTLPSSSSSSSTLCSSNSSMPSVPAPSTTATTTASLSSADLPAPLHMLHFGRMVAQNPWVRVLDVTNLSAASLVMEWTASEPSEISILIETPAEQQHYQQHDNNHHNQQLHNGERLHSASMPSLVEEDVDEHEHHSDTLHSVTDGVNESLMLPRCSRASTLAPGSALHSVWMRFLDFCRADSQHNYSQSSDASSVSSSSSSSPTSSHSPTSSSSASATLSSLLASSSIDPDLERQYLKRELNRRRDLQRVIAEQLLTPLDKLHLASFQTVRVYVVWTVGAVPRPWLSTRMRSLDAAIRITLLRYPRPPDSEDRPPLDPTPVRFVPLQCMACQSQLDVAQRHIAFGVLTSMAAHERQLQVHNQSEAPLLFAIRKTGSIASGDLLFPSHSMGVVRPYGRLEIPFVFAPSLAGAFAEPISIVNLQDHTQHNTVIIKALIKRPEHFWLRELQFHFGYVSLTRQSQHKQPAQSQSQLQLQSTIDVEHGDDEDEHHDSDPQLLIAVVGERVSHWLVVKNISLKQRTFKAQLRSIRLSSSRSKQDVLNAIMAGQERLMSISRQSSMELMHRSASVSSTFSPPSGDDEEASPSPSPPFSGASSPVHSLLSSLGHSLSSFPQFGPSASSSRPPSRLSGGGYAAPVATLPSFGSSSLLSSMSVPPSPVSAASAVTPTRHTSATPPPQSSAAAAHSPSAAVSGGSAGGAAGLLDAGHMSVSSSLSSLSSSSSHLAYLTSTPAAPPLCRLPIRPCVAFSLDEVTAGGDAGSLQEQTANEEEEEAIQRKLRIALRKHKHDKIDKLRKRLGELQTIAQKQRDREEAGQRRRQARDEQATTSLQLPAITSTPTRTAGSTPGSSPSQSPHKSDGQSQSRSTAGTAADSASAAPVRADDKRAVQLMLAQAEEGVMFTLDPNAVQSIRTDFHVNADSSLDVSVVAPDVVETYEGVIDVYESKNKDAVRAVHFTVHVCSDLNTAKAARQAQILYQRIRQQEQNKAAS